MGTGQGFFRAYVFGFRRFARQILMETGGMSKPHMTEVGRRLLLRRVLQQHGEQLSAFARAARQRGFSASLSDMLQELKSYRVEPEQLSDVAEKISDAYLAGKLSDLALLDRAFASAFEGRQLMDAGDLLNVLTEKIPQAEFLIKRGIKPEKIVIGHAEFFPDEKALLALLELGVNIGIDMIGQNGQDRDKFRADMVVMLRDRGFLSQVTLSMDLCEQRDLLQYGGFGYIHLFKSFLPLLRDRGITEDEIDLMLRRNPMRILG